MLTVRTACKTDIPRALEIYEDAREFMRTHGNPTQWATHYPDEPTLNADIACGTLFCVISDDDPETVCGVFALIGGEDPTYATIYEGSWEDPSPYGTIHRVASDGTHSGVFAAAARFARTHYNHLRVDTHRDNLPMQRSIERAGFEYRGIIYIEDGTPRLAFEWTAPPAV